ncbi:MAG: M48 family metalloprotease [Candidatus Cloacimonetes bacterium]|nr:M48 family metalloprotease [Candidatus Cloacimonadota bacterium]MCF7813992.1 M48 family metalloprotease [Candidatus Cloacimonadota bacterium]MCF7868620.1 M48 family metalloprotease [Candidatus Cloacimonadota bacterium]MCF7882849.1 M48 family metalloprotease [Candidatus Cloacimonadota bacterium]
MKHRFLSFFLFIVFVLFAANSAVVKRDRAIFRTGPGSFYEVEAELAKGANFEILEEEKGWYRIELASSSGYVSTKVTQEQKTSDDIFGKMGTQQTDLKISKYGMSAGVKGFAERFTQSFKGSANFFQIYADYKLDAKAFKNFWKETYRDFKLKKNQKNIAIPPARFKDYFSQSEEGLGIGIASQIAAMGLYQNPELVEYINQVGNVVVEATDVYDIGFKFFILDTEKVNGYACPGGIVFVTKGMLKMIRTEAELATVLAHEIAHVARHHGMLEMAERQNQIKAEDAFAELEMEMDDFGIKQDEEMKSVEEEMEQLSFEIFETLVNGRLEQYEQEADQLAIIFASRAGYNGRELLTLLNRLKTSSSQTTNEHYTQKQIIDRIGMIKNYLNSIQLSSNLFSNQNRWQKRSGM